MIAPQVLVIAKAPVPGRVKTRLAVEVGDDLAARIAAASLLDTVDACTAAVGPQRCLMAVDGDLGSAVEGGALVRALRGWDVVAQVSGTLGERIAAAFGELDTPVLQIGMDTPQVTPCHLHAAAAALADEDAVLGPAQDGGWWLLGLQRPRHAAVVASVEMSTDHTGEQTRAALVGAGLRVAETARLRDIDHLDDLVAVCAAAPATRTAMLAGEVLR